MKVNIKDIFTSALILVMAVLFAVPLIAQVFSPETQEIVNEQDTIPYKDQSLAVRIQELTKDEPRPDRPSFYIAEKMHYLHNKDLDELDANICKQPLGYKAKGNTVNYYFPTDKYEFKEEKCKGLSTFNQQKINEIVEKGEVPDICTQFDVMSYLISQNDNMTLRKVLEAGYEPRLYIKINNKETRWLYTQAILSLNNDALGELNWQRTKNCEALYNSDDYDMAFIQNYDFKEILKEFFEEGTLGPLVPVSMRTFHEMIRYRTAKGC